MERARRTFLIISKINKDEIGTELYWDSEKEGVKDESTSERELIYSDTDTLNNLASIICTGIDSLLGRHTLKDYKEKWISSDFPEEKFKRLQLLLH